MHYTSQWQSFPDSCPIASHLYRFLPLSLKINKCSDSSSMSEACVCGCVRVVGDSSFMLEACVCGCVGVVGDSR